MKKFTLMILGVSIFFIGLGGIVRQVAAGFKSDNYVLSTVQHLRTEVGEEEKTKTVKSLTIYGQGKEGLIIDGVKVNKRTAIHQFKLQVPSNQFKTTLSYPRQPSTEPLSQGEEFPRVNDEDVIIYKRQNSNEKSDETKTPRVRVFINQEKDSK